MPEKNINDIILILSQIKEENGVPRNVKDKIDVIVGILQEETDVSIKISRVSHELDEISAENNLEPHTRTQIWNVVSLLEKI